MTQALVIELIRSYGLWGAFMACSTPADFADFSNLTLSRVIREHLSPEESSSFVDCYLELVKR